MIAQCRYCGKVVCAKCSMRKLNKRPTHISKYSKAQQIKVRVCDTCYDSNIPKRPKKKSIAPPNASILDAIKSMNDGKPPDAMNKSAFGVISKSVPKKPAKKQNSNSLNDFVKKQEDELLKKFEQRAQKLQDEKAKKEKMSKNPLHKSVQTKKKHKKQDSMAPPPPPKKRNSAANLAKQFVVLDIEPKLIALEENKRKLENKVSGLQTENSELKKKVSALETENKNLQNALNEKDEEIKKLWAEIAKSGVVNLGLSQSNTSSIDLKLDDESPPNSFYPNSFESDHKMKEVQTRICITCNLPIHGRALKTKDGLIHKECHVCVECRKFLLGLKYAVLWEDDKKIKLCEECVEESREDRKKMAKESMSRKQTFVVSDDMD